VKQAFAFLPLRSGRIELVREQRIERFRGQQARLGDLSFKLLAVLADHAPAPVTYEQIARDVWDAHVTRETLKQRVKLLRDELRQLGVPEAAIEAVRNSGYRLMIGTAESGANQGWRVRPAVMAAIAAIGLLLAFWLAGRTDHDDRGPLTIAVAVDPTGRHAASLAGQMVRDGLVRNLARLDDVAVIRPASAGQPIRSDLLATIAVHPSGGQTKLGISLTEGSTGLVLWAESYGHDPARIDPTIHHAVNNMAAYALTFGSVLGDGGYRARPEPSRRAYIKALRWWRSGEESRLLEAQADLRAMLASDPGFHLARSLLARVEADLVTRHGHPASLVNDDEQAVARLLEQYQTFPDFRYSMARVQLALGHKERALTELRRALPGMPFLVRDIHALERELAPRDGGGG